MQMKNKHEFIHTRVDISIWFMNSQVTLGSVAKISMNSEGTSAKSVGHLVPVKTTKYNQVNETDAGKMIQSKGPLWNKLKHGG